MHIAAITQHGIAGWRTLKLDALTAGLNAAYGPPRSGKTQLANLLAHSLFGKSASPKSGMLQSVKPPGEVVVESDVGRHRVRRYYDDQGQSRLTVAALGGSAVDAGTMRQLTGGLSPSVLAPLCAVSFREAPNVADLLSADFARCFQTVANGGPTHPSRRTAELASRRDALAQELETRIANERRASKELEDRCRELDRLVRKDQEQRTVIQQRLQATEAALAETDARLRYRRLELNLDRQFVAIESEDVVAVDNESNLSRVRSMLADLAQQEATVRARLAKIEVAPHGGRAAIAESRSWIQVTRQLATDLSGEVARLARASSSQQCVCRDAHPRLRPISETIERQLDVLAKLIEEQQRSVVAVKLQAEVEYLTRSQSELRRHLEHLLERGQTARSSHRHRSNDGGPSNTFTGYTSFSAADAAQLETRLHELEQERFHLFDELRGCEQSLCDRRAQLDTMERQRAALLSARSIEYVQRELASVQQKLEQSGAPHGDAGDPTIAEESPVRASDFLAQFTDGEFVQLVLVEHRRRACVVNRAGQTLRVESLTASERGLVYLSLCLALVSAASRQGIRLPLVLDDPFERLDKRSTAALAAVLDDFCRQGHQVLIFTGAPTAVEQLRSVGAAMHDIGSQPQREAMQPVDSAETPITDQSKSPRQPGTAKKRKAKRRPRRSDSSRPTLNGDASDVDRSDAA